jgi:hypothetical protein
MQHAPLGGRVDGYNNNLAARVSQPARPPAAFCVLQAFRCASTTSAAQPTVRTTSAYCSPLHGTHRQARRCYGSGARTRLAGTPAPVFSRIHTVQFSSFPRTCSCGFPFLVLFRFQLLKFNYKINYIDKNKYMR